jgi:metal-responsive CopG/Arc/MetJ family transcriptional regulator
MKLINLNLRDDVVAEMDAVVKEFGFSNRTEFIRASIRERMEEYKMQKAIAALEKSRGVFKDNPTSDEEYERNREEAYKRYAAEIRARSRA